MFDILLMLILRHLNLKRRTCSYYLGHHGILEECIHHKYYNHNVHYIDTNLLFKGFQLNRYHSELHNSDSYTTLELHAQEIIHDFVHIWKAHLKGLNQRILVFFLRCYAQVKEQSYKINILPYPIHDEKLYRPYFFSLIHHNLHRQIFFLCDRHTHSRKKVL